MGKPRGNLLTQGICEDLGNGVLRFKQVKFAEKLSEFKDKNRDFFVTAMTVNDYHGPYVVVSTEPVEKFHGF